MKKLPMIKRPNDEARKSAEHAKARNHHTLVESIKSLEDTPRLKEKDAVIFANNLGRMFEHLRSKSEISTRKLFLEALGDKLGDSLYKKRKGLLLFKDEEFDAKLVRRSPHNFILLAKFIAEQVHAASDSREERDKTALSGLIYGSSFDQRESLSTRLLLDSWRDIDEAFNDLSEKLITAIDLDWMYEFCKRYPLSVVSSQAGILGPIFFGEERGFDSCHQSLDWNDHQDNWISYGVNHLAPAVRIAEIFDPLEDLDKLKCLPVIEVDLISGFDAADYALEIRRVISEKYNKPELLFDEPDFDLDDFFDSEGSVIPHYMSWYTALDMELLFDQNSLRWMPFFVWRAGAHFCESIYHGEYLTSIATADQRRDGEVPPCPQVIEVWIETLNDYRSCFAILDEWDHVAQRVSYKVFEPVIPWEFADPPSRRLTDDSVVFYQEFVARGPASLEILLFRDCRSFGKIVRPKLVRGEEKAHHYTPAPYFSLAGLILANLAYAPEDQRLDNLLIEDAKKKYDAMHKKQNQMQQDYAKGRAR